MSKKKAIKCPRCNGKGFLEPNKYQGRCLYGKRHTYSYSGGKRSDVCLRCKELKL